MSAVARRVILALCMALGLVAAVGITPAAAATQTITVTVVDPRTNQPITAYQTCIFATALTSGVPGARGCTGTKGTTTLTLDDASEFILSARTVPAGYLPNHYYGGTQDPASAAPVRPPANLTFPLPVAATATGTLTYPSGQPASNYTVTVRSTDGLAVAAATTGTGGSGTWTITSPLPPGTYTVQFSGQAGDSWAYGKTSAETATIIELVAGVNTINDTLVPPPGGFPLPVLNLPPSPVLVEANGPSGAFADYGSLVSATTASGVTVQPWCEPAAGAKLSFGDTTIACTATDPATGVSTSGQFVVRVSDTTGPVLTIPASITAVATGADGALVLLPASSAFDVVDGAVPVTCDRTASSVFPIGTTTVHCSASDSRGNTATGSYFVTVVPNQADLSVAVSGPTTLDKKQPGTWVVTVTNNGPAPATDVRLALSNRGLRVVSTSPTARITSIQVGSTTVVGPVLSVGTLPVGASASLTVTAAPTASRSGALTVTAGAVASVPDPTLSDNLAAVTTTVTK